MGKPPAGTNTGSLLRLFQSELFDAHLHMHYLLAMENGGVQDYLVNALYKMGDDDVDFYLPQLCQLALLRFGKSALHRFLLDKASKSMHFALKIAWLMQSYAEDKRPEIRDSAVAMANWCEEALVAAELSPVGGESAQHSFHAHGHGHEGRRQRVASTAFNLSAACVAGGAGGGDEGGDRADGKEGSPTKAGAVTAVASPVSGTRSATPTRRRAQSCPPQLTVRADAQEQELEELVAVKRLSTTPTGVLRGLCGDQQGGPEEEAAGGEADAAPITGEGPASSSRSPREQPQPPPTPTPAQSRGKVLRHFVGITEAISPERWAEALRVGPAPVPNAYVELGHPVVGWMLSAASEAAAECHLCERSQFMLKQLRRDFFDTQQKLIGIFAKLTSALLATPEREERKARLRSGVRLLNRWLLDRRIVTALAGDGLLGLLGLHLPCLCKRDYKQQVLHVHAEQCKVFSSATRAPFLLVYETADLDEVAADASALEAGGGTPSLQLPPRSPAASAASPLNCHVGGLGAGSVRLADCLAEELRAAGCMEVPPDRDAAAALLGSSMHPLSRRLATLSADEWLGVPAGQPAQPEPAPLLPQRCAHCPHAAAWQDVEETAQAFVPSECATCRAREVKEKACAARMAIWGESWASRLETTRRSSPYGRYSSWALKAIVVKGGDDLRQELLASQVIKVFSDIFKEARLRLWLREIEVLVTSGSSGCIEFLHDSMNVSAIKKLYPDKSLAEIFQMAFADQLFTAKRNFIESYAAYSLVVWFLQVKDRHNENLMMLSDGRVVHLDFGYMLSNSPGGNMGFEQSPFKLTQEFLDVMGGEFSDEYEYFRTLVVRGFLEARKHADRIVLPIRMLLSSGSKLPCFRDGLEWVLQTLQDRFYINLTEEACIEKVLELIDTSVNHWSTVQYDAYQKFVNGIV